MADLTVTEMLEMQEKLQEKYREQWEPVVPDSGKNKVLWMMSEVGEVIDVIKKQGPEKIMEDPEVRAHFVEEMADVLMFYHDILLCYGITAEELRGEYVRKFERNLNRW